MSSRAAFEFISFGSVDDVFRFVLHDSAAVIIVITIIVIIIITVLSYCRYTYLRMKLPGPNHRRHCKPPHQYRQVLLRSGDFGAIVSVFFLIIFEFFLDKIFHCFTIMGLYMRAAARPSDFGPLHGLASAGRRDSNDVHTTVVNELYLHIY